VERLTAVTYAAGGPFERLAGRAVEPDGLHWDHDPLATVILYNEHLLAVCDRNGGRVTHLFALVDGVARCVSGTFKCYQFQTGMRAGDDFVNCDGPVLQNTVFTPNHAYLGTDVAQSLGIRGTYVDPRRAGPQPLWYPDNFNAYEVVPDGTRAGFRYGPGTAPPATIDLDAFRRLLAADRAARLEGRGEPVVWHDPAAASFEKAVALDGRTLTVSYTGVAPGHLVANEFCVDLWTATMHGAPLTRRLAATAGRLTLADGSGAVGVTVEPRDNCEFSPDMAATTAHDGDRCLLGQPGAHRPARRPVPGGGRLLLLGHGGLIRRSGAVRTAPRPVRTAASGAGAGHARAPGRCCPPGYRGAR
jgi:hypothetical protein